MKKIGAGPGIYPGPLSHKLIRIMKLTVLLLTFACLQVSAHTYSQEKITLKITAGLKKVLSEIEKNSNYRFLFDEEVMRGKPTVTVDVKDAAINDVLATVFSNTGIAYRILNTNLIVLKSNSDITEIGIKDIPVRGTVLNESGQPLAGVSVSIRGSSFGTVTNADGVYSLTVPESAVLVFSYVGFTSVEEPINGRSIINITLKPAVGSLNEVVVIGYGTQRKRDLTGSITSIRGEELARMPATNPVSSLQGKVAGLTIVNSGRAGASPTVRIRGVNSTSNTDPLYVVDGVFQTNIDYLNPADIETIEVLRDPSSIAIFGLQGGNGVIVVTTKRAGRGETRVTLQSSVGIQRVNNKIDVTDATGFRKLHTAQLQNIGAAPFDYSNYTGNTDWQSLIFRNAIINNNSITVSTNSEKGATLFNLAYNNQQGVVKNDHHEKFIARFNQEVRMGKNVKLGGDITGFHWRQENPAADINNALWAAPIVPVMAAEGLYYSMPSFQRAQVGNPVARLDRNTGISQNKGYRVVGSIFGEVKFLQDFTFRTAFYTDLGFNNSRSYTPFHKSW
jgi:TonB-linked SusC/RagA family outer membrane protein